MQGVTDQANGRTRRSKSIYDCAESRKTSCFVHVKLPNGLVIGVEIQKHEIIDRMLAGLSIRLRQLRRLSHGVLKSICGEW